MLARASLPLVLALAAGCAHSGRVLRGGDSLTASEHVALGASYEGRGLREQARRQYRNALSHDKGAALALLALGNLEYQDGKLARAARCYKRALELEPGNGKALNNLAMVRLAQGRAEEAEELARRAAMDPRAARYAAETLEDIRRARTGGGGVKPDSAGQP